MLVPIPVTLCLILNFDSNTYISEWLGTFSFAKCDTVFVKLPLLPVTLYYKLSANELRTETLILVDELPSPLTPLLVIKLVLYFDIKLESL